MSFWAELKRRNVFRVAAAYLVASWLIVQVIGELIEPLSLPDSFATIVVVLLGIGFPIALAIAWIYEVTPEGIRVTTDAATSRRRGQPILATTRSRWKSCSEPTGSIWGSSLRTH